MMESIEIKMFENGLIWILAYLVLTTGLIATFIKVFNDKKDN